MFVAPELKCRPNPLKKTVPVFAVPLKRPTTTLFLGVNAIVNATGHLLWTINNRTFVDDISDPILLIAKEDPNYGHPADWSVYNIGSNSTVQIVLQNQQPAATNISHVKFPSF